jgi:hypothetical protein
MEFGSHTLFTAGLGTIMAVKGDEVGGEEEEWNECTNPTVLFVEEKKS